MFRIRYYYSSLAKQFFLVTIIIALLLRFILFFAGGFYRYAFVGATVALYAFAVAVCCFFLVAWKFFYTEFDNTSVIWRNRIIGKEIRVDIAQITRAIFSKSGIFLYCQKSEKPCLASNPSAWTTQQTQIFHCCFNHLYGNMSICEGVTQHGRIYLFHCLH